MNLKIWQYTLATGLGMLVAYLLGWGHLDRLIYGLFMMTYFTGVLYVTKAEY